MDLNTRFIYENSLGRLEFARNLPFWISEIEGVSSVQVDISESRGNRQVGSTIANQSIQPRGITVDGVIFEPVKAHRKRLIAVMAPEVKSRLTVVDGSDSYYVEVVPLHTPEIEPGDALENWQVQLHAPYPYWMTTQIANNMVAGIVPLFMFPFYTGGTWWISQPTADYYNTITNPGNVLIGVEVVFTARAEVTNPQVYHMGTQKKLQVNRTMVPGEEIRISTVYGSKGVTIKLTDGTVINGFSMLTIDSDLSFELLPGENLIRTDASSGREAMNAVIPSPVGVVSGV